MRLLLSRHALAIERLGWAQTSYSKAHVFMLWNPLSMTCLTVLELGSEELIQLQNTFKTEVSQITRFYSMLITMSHFLA